MHLDPGSYEAIDRSLANFVDCPENVVVDANDPTSTNGVIAGNLVNALTFTSQHEEDYANTTTAAMLERLAPHNPAYDNIFGFSTSGEKVSLIPMPKVNASDLDISPYMNSAVIKEYQWKMRREEKEEKERLLNTQNGSESEESVGSKMQNNTIEPSEDLLEVDPSLPETPTTPPTVVKASPFAAVRKVINANRMKGILSMGTPAPETLAPPDSLMVEGSGREKVMRALRRIKLVNQFSPPPPPPPPPPDSSIEGSIEGETDGNATPLEMTIHKESATPEGSVNGGVLGNSVGTSEVGSTLEVTSQIARNVQLTSILSTQLSRIVSLEEDLHKAIRLRCSRQHLLHENTVAFRALLATLMEKKRTEMASRKSKVKELRYSTDHKTAHLEDELLEIRAEIVQYREEIAAVDKQMTEEETLSNMLRHRLSGLHLTDSTNHVKFVPTHYQNALATSTTAIPAYGNTVSHLTAQSRSLGLAAKATKRLRKRVAKNTADGGRKEGHVSVATALRAGGLARKKVRVQEGSPQVFSEGGSAAATPAARTEFPPLPSPPFATCVDPGSPPMM